MQFVFLTIYVTTHFNNLCVLFSVWFVWETLADLDIPENASTRNAGLTASSITTMLRFTRVVSCNSGRKSVSNKKEWYYFIWFTSQKGLQKQFAFISDICWHDTPPNGKEMDWILLLHGNLKLIYAARWHLYDFWRWCSHSFPMKPRGTNVLTLNMTQIKVIPVRLLYWHASSAKKVLTKKYIILSFNSEEYLIGMGLPEAKSWQK